MGTWDVGPFDNDAAADWCGDLADATPADRPGRIRDALTAATGDEYLDQDVAAAAIAAAAIVAAQLPGGSPIDSSYAPDFLLEGGAIEVPPDIPPLALSALDRVVDDDSEWRELWEDAPESYQGALEVLRSIRAPLERAAAAHPDR